MESLSAKVIIHSDNLYFFTKYIYQEFNESNVLRLHKKVSSFQTLCLIIFNVICYGVNREVRQQLTSSAIL